MSQSKVNRLVRQIGDTEPVRPRRWDNGLTVTEQRFFREAMGRKKAKMWRHGWPDFLMHTEELGYVGVEVKAGEDRLRESQIDTFSALEKTGLRIFVWNPKDPDRLIPWRRMLVWQQEGDKLRTAKRIRRMLRSVQETGPASPQSAPDIGNVKSERGQST